MELLIGLLVSAATAILGGWVGFFFAKRNENKIRTADICVELLSGDFSLKRVRLLKLIRGKSLKELQDVLKQDSEISEDLRQLGADVFNKYDLVCYLYNDRALSTSLFDGFGKEIISSDYREADTFFAAMEADYKDRGIDEKRPFFKEVAKAFPRM